jgi:hypothetical protein
MVLVLRIRFAGGGSSPVEEVAWLSGFFMLALKFKNWSTRSVTLTNHNNCALFDFRSLYRRAKIFLFKSIILFIYENYSNKL